MERKSLLVLCICLAFFSVSNQEQAHSGFNANAVYAVPVNRFIAAEDTYVSVVDYGAVADGNGVDSGTDNLGAFQNAVTAALAQGKDLKIPGASGYYRIRGCLAINENNNRGITLLGDGPTLSKIHFDLAPSTDGLKITGPANRAPLNISNLAIKKTKTGFDGAKLVVVTNARDFYCSNLDISGSTGFSLTIANSVNGIIEGNYVHDTVLITGCDGIHVVDGEGSSADIEIRNNTVRNTGDDGISVGCHANGTVRTVRVHHNNIQYIGCSGIKIHEGAQEIDVYSNTILDTDLGGIGVEATKFGNQNIQNIRIYNNTIRRSCRKDAGYWGGIAVVDRSTEPCQVSGFEIHDNTIRNFKNRWGILIGAPDEGSGECITPVRDGTIWNNTIIDMVTPPRADKLIGILCAEDISLQPPPPPPPPPPTTLSVNLQASNGQFVVAEEGGGGIVNANRDWAGPWETFLLTDLNGGDLRHGDQVTFQCYNPAYYLQAVNGGCGDCPLLAWGAGPGPWETFVVIDVDHPGDALHSGERIALRTWNGYYVVAELGGGDVVNANRTAIGPWEIFVLHVR